MAHEALGIGRQAGREGCHHRCQHAGQPSRRHRHLPWVSPREVSIGLDREMIHRARLEGDGRRRTPWASLLVLCGLLALHNAMRIGPVTFIEELRGRYGADYAGAGNVVGATRLPTALPSSWRGSSRTDSEAAA